MMVDRLFASLFERYTKREEQLNHLRALVDVNKMDWVMAEIKDIATTTIVPQETLASMIYDKVASGKTVEDSVTEVRAVCNLRTAVYMNAR